MGAVVCMGGVVNDLQNFIFRVEVTLDYVCFELSV